MTTINLKPSDWLTADTHAGGCPYPYSLWLKYVDEADRWKAWLSMMARKWDELVAPKDSVLILGDALEGLKGPKHDAALEWFASRPGHKILVPGNHDAPHPLNTVSEQEIQRDGWDEIFQVISPDQATVKIAGSPELPVSHFPATMKYWEEHKNTLYPSRPLLHGHTHSMKRTSEGPYKRLQINVSWTAWRAPASAQSVLDLVKIYYEDNLA